MAIKRTHELLPTSAANKRCGLCGKTADLVRTECCGNWICDDAESYVLFSYAHNSCHRNHTRFTVCGMHYAEGHEGSWKSCKECLENVPTEMYVWYGSNEYNFEVLENPPAYDPTHCSKCNRIIRLAEESHILASEGYVCADCGEF